MRGSAVPRGLRVLCHFVHVRTALFSFDVRCRDVQKARATLKLPIGDTMAEESKWKVRGAIHARLVLVLLLTAYVLFRDAGTP